MDSPDLSLSDDEEMGEPRSPRTPSYIQENFPRAFEGGITSYVDPGRPSTNRELSPQRPQAEIDEGAGPRQPSKGLAEVAETQQTDVSEGQKEEGNTEQYERDEDLVETMDTGRERLVRRLPEEFDRGESDAKVPDLNLSDRRDKDELQAQFFAAHGIRLLEPAAGEGAIIRSLPHSEGQGRSRESSKVLDQGKSPVRPAERQLPIGLDKLQAESDEDRPPRTGRDLRKDWPPRIDRPPRTDQPPRTPQTPRDIYHPDLFQENHLARARARQAALSATKASDRRDESGSTTTLPVDALLPQVARNKRQGRLDSVSIHFNPIGPHNIANEQQRAVKDRPPHKPAPWEGFGVDTRTDVTGQE